MRHLLGGVENGFFVDVGCFHPMRYSNTWMLYRRGSRDPLRAAYDAFCAKLAAKGLARAAHEGPWDYAARISAARPELRPSVQHITRAYVDLRYAGYPW